MGSQFGCPYRNGSVARVVWTREESVTVETLSRKHHVVRTSVVAVGSAIGAVRVAIGAIGLAVGGRDIRSRAHFVCSYSGGRGSGLMDRIDGRRDFQSLDGDDIYTRFGGKAG